MDNVHIKAFYQAADGIWHDIRDLAESHLLEEVKKEICQLLEEKKELLERIERAETATARRASMALTRAREVE